MKKIVNNFYLVIINFKFWNVYFFVVVEILYI